MTLTIKEMEWLERRSHRCKRCTHYRPNLSWCNCIYNFATDAYSLVPDYRDAAEFEARVALLLAGIASKDIPFDLLKASRFSVESEMETLDSVQD